MRSIELLAKSWVLPIFMLSLFSTFPAPMGNLKFVPIHKTLTIKANKRLPPHIAFMESHFESQNTEWREFEKKAKKPLAVGLNSNLPQGNYILTQRKELEGFIIRKSPEVLNLALGSANKTPVQATQEVEGPQWLKNIINNPPAETNDSTATAERGPAILAVRRVTGPIEISGGLAVTNEHHIEVRRADEGIFREMGQVDLMKGSYSIDIDEPTGALVARLMDRQGTVLGEGSVRLAQLRGGQGSLIAGPRLEISPSPAWPGTVSKYYSGFGKGSHKDDETFRVTTFGGQNPVMVSSKGEIKVENVSRNSTTIVRAEARNHRPSSKILVMGAKPLDMTVFPDSMMTALKNIIVDQENGKATDLDNTSIVWGTVSLDGKPLSGVTVMSETEPETKAIYFNEFMIPDPKLTATSANGLFAFLDLPEGFHALLAQRGNAYFGHQNVEVEAGSVALGDIESTLRTEAATVRAFDAFSGEPLTLLANMQSLPEPVEVREGTASVVLPQVSRLSMVYTTAPPEYVGANYFYNDKDSYVHLPMISQNWLSSLRAEKQINQVPRTGIIIGFFNEENFDAYLAGMDNNPNLTILYFDAAGKVLDSPHGSAGGGFVIFNVPYGTQEAVIVGRSEKISSKVVPVDYDTVSVLTFSSY